MTQNQETAGRTVKATSIELTVVNNSDSFSYDLLVKDQKGNEFKLSNHRDRDTSKAEISEIFLEIGRKWPAYGLSFVIDDYDEIVRLAKP